MRIMSLNGWGCKLHQPLLAFLRAEPPDVLCLQEVVHKPQSTQPWLIYRDGSHVLEQRANFFADVAAALPGHAGIFCQAAQGVLWHGETAIPSQWGLATFVRHRLPILAQAQGFVHKVFSAHGYGDHPRSRTGHALRVYDFDADRAVCIAHMHGLRDLAGKHDTPERLVQAERFAALIQQVAEPGDPVVACGDFNVEPESRTFAVLAELGLADLVTGRGHAGTRTALYTKPGRFADYLLVNPQVEVRDFAVIRAPEVSDHCPLLLTM
jgi:endonuclease/exonuclease/phosphatase family metal-dependent hydrolase